MEIHFQNLGPEHWKAEIVLAFGCEGGNILEENPELDKICPWLAIAPAMRDFRGKKGELAVMYGHPDLAVPRALLIGLGARDGVNIAGIRNAVGEAIQKCRQLELESVLLPEPFLSRMPAGGDRLVEECVYAACLGLYEYTEFKTDKKEISTVPKWLAIGFDGQTVPDGGQAAARKGENSAAAVMLARDLDNAPGNYLYPETLALRANDLAAGDGFQCEILNEEALEQNGLGCLLAVGRGSAHPPRLIILEHAPAGNRDDKPIVLIGKGITFDSGGLCIKPAANMDQMKCDMSGAAAVLAVVDALARENAPRRVIGLLACAENMPDGAAYRPGDILYAANGESVEVINTDAEGRLALCDAICYARKKWTPAAMVDIATLTGACAVALGNNLAGLFCDDDDFAGRITALGASAGENFWRLPLWEAYEERLKSRVADICHASPSRDGGAITAALFLKHFVAEGSLWAHLDIAGVDWNGARKPLCPEGATAFGVRTLLALCRGGVL